MSDEMRAEAVDMVVTAVEKHIGNYEVILFDAKTDSRVLGGIQNNQGINGQASRKFLACRSRRGIWI